MARRKRGLFVCLEGPDGSGQTTQAKILADWLRGRGERVVLTKEPTDTIMGGVIREVLRKSISRDPLALQLLFSADRAQHLKDVIEPALAQGKIVVTDRYALSTFAYGALDVKGDGKFLRLINSKFRVPDVTVFINTPIEECLRRIKKDREHIELFEERVKAKKVLKNYLRLIKSKVWPRIYVVDGSGSIEEVSFQIKKTTEKFLYWWARPDLNWRH